MTLIARKIPALRFPEFEGEWELILLKELANIYDGTHQTPTYVDSGIKFVSVEDIRNINETKKFITKQAFEKNFKTKPQKGDILMTRITAGVIGATAIIEDDSPFGYYVSLALIRIKSKVGVHFLNQRISSQEFKRELHKRIIHVAFPKKINLGDIGYCKLTIPSTLEQQKIATFLTTIDTRIQQLSRKKALLQQYKKGVMQQLFSQEIRFKDEDGKEFPAWEEKRLGEIGTTFGGLSGKTKENFGRGKPYITYKQIFDNSEINISKFDFVEIGQGEKQSRVQYGDVFFTTSSETPNEVGFASVLLEPVDELYLNSFCFGYRPNSFNLLKPDFARFLFRSQQFREMVVKLAQGSTRYNMSKTQLMKLKVSLPAEPEQQKIATFLSTIDRQINLATQQLNRMQTFKKGLLQQMFV